MTTTAIGETPLRVRASGRTAAASPLRYPGGKAALAGFFGDVINRLGIEQPRYVEPYAGGVGAGSGHHVDSGDRAPADREGDLPAQGPRAVAAGVLDDVGERRVFLIIGEGGAQHFGLVDDVRDERSTAQLDVIGVSPDE